MKLAFVVPRYGEEVIGGAETGARTLAINLVRILGWEVQVLTTTALAATTWDAHYPPGITVESGVEVHRFPIESGRHPDFARRSNDFFSSGPHDAAAQLRWVTEQGPVSQGLIEAVATSDADRLAFYPYLFHPTVVGLPLVAERAVLHAAAHDEPPIRMDVVGDVFRAAPALVLHSHAEQRLVARLFPEAISRPQIVLGLGVEEGTPTPGSGRGLLGPFADDPYLLCLGRVDEGKGVDALIGYFAAYKALRPSRLRLVVAGPIGTTPPEHPDVVLTGPVDEGAKWDLLGGSVALVSPSPNESFSLVLLESWLAGRPVLANAHCEPTRDHCLESQGGITFRDLAEFTTGVDAVQQPAVADALARKGRRYVDERYTWPRLVERYSRFLEVTAPR